MQKKHLNKARRAKTGMTGEAGKAGTQGTADRPENTGIAGKVDTLTPEQRGAKRLRDREYRARKRAAERAAGRAAKAGYPADCTSPENRCGADHAHSRSSHGCCSCGQRGKGLGPAKVPESGESGGACGGSASRAADAQDVFSLIGRIVVGELAKVGVPSASRNCTRPVQVERGVLRQEAVLPDGRRAVVTLVDGDEVDPLSPNSPVPWPIRRHLLLRRMAREISGIVDSHMECS